MSVLVASARADAQAADPPGGQFIVDSIGVIALDLFEGTSPWPVIGPAMDFFHAKTRTNALLQEVFLRRGDTIDVRDVDELQYRLRALGAFAEIKILLRAVSDGSETPHGTLIVQTRDTWSILLLASFGRSQDETAYSAALTDFNLLGTANRVGIGVDYSSLGNRGYRYYSSYRNGNLFGSFLSLDASVVAGQSESALSGRLALEPFSDRFRTSFAASTSYFDGNEIVYPNTSGMDQRISVPVRTVDAGAWFSRSNGRRGDVFRWSAALRLDRTSRDSFPALAGAFENTVSLFLGISSHRRSFTFVENADFNGQVQVPLGAYGSVSVGRIAPFREGGANLVYIGADAGKSIRSGGFYANAEAAAGTGFHNRTTSFTTFMGVLSGAWLLNRGALVGRIDQTTVWNWPGYVASFQTGGLVRGYERAKLASDNQLRMIAEYRMNPIVRVLAFDLGAVAFFEVGGYWNQGMRLSSTRFHSSAGFGARVGYAGSQFGKGILRVDLAWNFDENRLSKILIGTEEAFDVFGTLAYRPPGPYTY